MNQTQSVATNMQVHLNSGKFLESDATALATALQLSFANWAETGFTAILQNWILANAPLYTTATPTAQQLQAAYQQLVKLGVANVTLTQFENSIIGAPLASREQFISIIQTNGLQYLHNNIVAVLSTYGSTGASNRPSGGFQTAGVRIKLVCDLIDPDDGSSYKAFGRTPQFSNTGFLLTGGGSTPPWLTIAGLYLSTVAVALGVIATAPISGPVLATITVVGAVGIALSAAGAEMGC